MLKKMISALMAAVLMTTLFCAAEHNGQTMAAEPVFTQESLEKMYEELAPGSPYEGQMLTYTFDEDGNIIRVEEEVTPRSGLLISVLIGATVLGALTVVVVGGKVTSASAPAGSWWAGQAISSVLNRPYQSRIYINCNIYPMHSYEGAMCRQYQ